MESRAAAQLQSFTRIASAARGICCSPTRPKADPRGRLWFINKSDGNAAAAGMTVFRGFAETVDYVVRI